MRPIALCTPRDMDDARATLTDPSRHGCIPAVIQTNWQFLAEARGIRLRMERLAITAHLIDRPSQHAPVIPAPDAELIVTLPDGTTRALPVTTSLSYDLGPTVVTSSLVDELAASCGRVSDRVRDMLRARRHLPASGDDPQGAA